MSNLLDSIARRLVSTGLDFTSALRFPLTGPVSTVLLQAASLHPSAFSPWNIKRQQASSGRGVKLESWVLFLTSSPNVGREKLKNKREGIKMKGSRNRRWKRKWLKYSDKKGKRYHLSPYWTAGRVNNIFHAIWDKLQNLIQKQYVYLGINVEFSLLKCLLFELQIYSKEHLDRYYSAVLKIIAKRLKIGQAIDWEKQFREYLIIRYKHWIKTLQRCFPYALKKMYTFLLG